MALQVDGRRPGGPTESPGFQLWLVTLAWQRAVAAALRPHGLTHVQFLLLAGTRWLTEQDAPPTQRQIADHAGIDVMMTSQVLRRLEAHSLVERLADDADGRARRVRLTHAGSRLLDQVLPVVEDVDAQFFAPVNRRELL